MAKPIIPLETRAKAIEPVPGGGSGPPNGSARASERSTTGPGRTGWNGRVAGRERERRPGAPRRSRNAGDGDDAEALRRGVEESGLEDALMREVAEVAGKDPGADSRRLSNRGKTLPVDRSRPACSPGSMACLPGIAPGGHHCRHAGLSVDEYAGLGTEAEGDLAAHVCLFNRKWAV